MLFGQNKHRFKRMAGIVGVLSFHALLNGLHQEGQSGWQDKLLRRNPAATSIKENQYESFRIHAAT
jgi:hypothetical protein